MTTRLRIKMGSTEFEYEGDIALSVNDVREIIILVEGLFKLPVIIDEVDNLANDQPTGGEPSSSKAPNQKLHVNSVAKKMTAKTGPQVAEAAAAALQIFDGKESFTRAELLETMKKANLYYKESMAGNLSKILETLVGARLNQLNDGVYSLTADAYAELATKLA